jgi:hypothetical protein
MLLTRKHGVMHQMRGSVHPWQSVSGTRKHLEQLWDRVDEIDDLRNEQQEQRFGEMAMNADHSKGHSRKVAECIANEHLGGEPIVMEKS